MPGSTGEKDKAEQVGSYYPAHRYNQSGTFVENAWTGLAFVFSFFPTLTQTFTDSILAVMTQVRRCKYRAAGEASPNIWLRDRYRKCCLSLGTMLY